MIIIELNRPSKLWLLPFERPSKKRAQMRCLVRKASYKLSIHSECMANSGRKYVMQKSYPQKMHLDSLGGFNLAFLEHLNAAANSGMLLNVPSTLNRVGECGSVRIRCTAAAGFIALAHILANEMKNSCSLLKFNPGRRYSYPASFDSSY